MCDAINWRWWIVFIAIVTAGLVGGWGRYHWEKMDGNDDVKFSNFAVIGIVAALMVPLFLNTISSNLINDAQQHQDKLFVLIGFCLAAAVFAKQFIGSVGKKALEISEDAKKSAARAEAIAGKATEKASNADNRALAVVSMVIHCDAERFDRAVNEAETVLRIDPENAEAWAWKAFALKRLNRFAEAVTAIERAIELEPGKNVLRWLYNLACYRALNNVSIDKIIEPLKLLAAYANEDFKTELKRDLSTDEDFASIKNDGAFKAFIDSI